jgi:hypothetical protein
VKYQKEAYGAWKNFYQPASENAALVNYVNGTLSCFCNDEYNRDGFWVAYNQYRSDGID